MTSTFASAVPSLDQWQRRVSRLFENAAPAASEWMPRADIQEAEAGLSIQFDLAGVRREDLDIQVEKGVLKLRGERKLTAAQETFLRVERPYGAFTRSFALPDFVNSEAIEAKLADGVLTLFLPRLEETKPKQIQVQVQPQAA